LLGGFSVIAEEELGRAMGSAQRVPGGRRGGIRLTTRGARGEWCLAHAVHAKVQRRTQSISGGSGRDKKQGAWAVLCGRLLGWMPWARANEYGHLQFIQAILKGT
jgi:hypothetical protein